MGIVARILGFIWKRWADYQSVVAILDALDLKTAVTADIAFVAMMFFGSTNMQWSPPAVVLAALAAAAFVSVTLVSIRMLWRSRSATGAAQVSGAGSAMSAEFASDIPDVRVADDAVAWGAFWPSTMRQASAPPSARKNQSMGPIG